MSSIRHRARCCGYRPSFEPLEDRTVLTTLLATTGANLLRFDSATPGTVTTTTVTGLGAGESLEGIDFRPATGELFGLGVSPGTARLLTINPATGAATPVGGTFAVTGTDFGFDFNPTNDRLRVVSDADINLLVDPNTGAVTPQTNLNPGTPNVVGVAYSNNFGTATTTTLFGIDSGTDQLVIQNPPASGTLTAVGALGLDVNGNTGFEITGDGTAYAVFTLPSSSGTTLATINLTTGAATSIGTLGGAVGSFRGLTAMRFVWDGGGIDDNWTTAANWVGDVAPAVGDDLVFPAGAARQATSNNDFLGGTRFNSITFTGSGYDLDGNDILLSATMLDTALSGNNDVDLNITLGGLLIFSVASASESLFLGGSLVGSGVAVNLTKEKPGATTSNSGTLRLEGAVSNTYNGTTIVNGGTLELAKVGATAIPGPLVIGDGVGGALADIVQELTNNNIPDTLNVSITSSGLFGLSAGVTDAINGLSMIGGVVDTSTGTLTVNGTVTATGDATGLGASIAGNLVVTNGTFDVADAPAAIADLDVNAVIGGAAGLTKNGTGRMVISGANTYSGATVVNAGSLALGVVNGVPPTSQLTVQSPAVFDLSGFDQTISSLNGNGSIANSTANIATLTINTGSADLFNGQIQGSINLVKAGTGTLTLSSANTYTGQTTVNAGTLTSGATGSLPVDSTLTVNAPGIFDLAGFDQQLAVILGSGTITNSSGNLATLTVNNAVDVTFPGLLAGNLALTKTNAGILTLTGNNQYTQATTINAGQLVVNGTQPLSPITASSGTTLGGTGVTGRVTTIGGTLSPGSPSPLGSQPGVLTTRGIVFNSGTFLVNINGASAGSQYDVLNVQGNVTISNGDLSLVLGAGTAIPVGTTLAIINNDGSDSITGTFNGLPEGFAFTLNNGSIDQRFRISYVGGDGNDAVLIREDVVPPPQGDIERFVTALYSEVLDRDPDAGGFAFWVGVLRRGQVNRVQVSNGFLRSAERQVLVVESFYVQILNRPSDPFRVVWINGLVSGRMTEAQVVVAFVTSDEFTRAHPDDRSYVTDIYRILLDRPNGTSAGEIDFQLQALKAGLSTRAGMALSFMASDEALGKAIDSFYSTYLDRTPATAELDIWFAAVRAGGLDSAAVQSLFLGSDEFFRLVNT